MSTSHTLRPYQNEALQGIEQAHSEHRRTLLSLPTGTGKTFVAATYAKRRFLDSGRKVLWIAHTEELLEQAYNAFLSLGIHSDRAARRYAKHKEFESKPDAVIWFMSNLVRTGPPDVDLIVVDEAHHAAAQSYIDWLSLYKTHRPTGPHVLGLTATPYRLHEGEVEHLLNFKFSKPRVPIFESMAYNRSFCELVNQGFLAPFQHSSIQTNQQHKLSLVNGEFSNETLKQLDNPSRNRLIYDTWKKNQQKYGKTIIFVGTQDHARSLAKLFGSDGDYVTSERSHEERAHSVQRFRNGELKVLVNVSVFGEGFDVPDIRTVILARPTASPVRFTQMVGRGSRIKDGKRFFYLLDIHDQLGKYEQYLVKVDDLAGDRPELVEVVRRRAKAAERLQELSEEGLDQSTCVMADLIGLNPDTILRTFKGWVTFQTADGKPSQVGALLTEKDYDQLLLVADDRRRLLPEVVESLRRFPELSESLGKCSRALAEGLIGELHEFVNVMPSDLEEIQEQALIAYNLNDPMLKDLVLQYKRDLERVASAWGIRESNVASIYESYFRSPLSAAAAIKLHGADGPFLRLVGPVVFGIIRRAIDDNLAGTLKFSDGARVLKAMEDAEPDLEPYSHELISMISDAHTYGDVAIECPGIMGSALTGPTLMDTDRPGPDVLPENLFNRPGALN
jgi:superfamily II DNA or RNA helicase